MREWITRMIFLFLLGLVGRKGVLALDEGLFRNLLLEETVDEAQCEQMQMKNSAADSAMLIDKVPNLLGEWVSQDCEVRPGPEFILRSYTFMNNNSFRLLQHHYEDESCILPLYTVIAKGSLTLKAPSWETPSGTEFEYLLTRVTVIPHVTETAEKLSKEQKKKCFNEVKGKSWKPHREYVVYNHQVTAARRVRSQRKFVRYRRRKFHKNFDCLSAMEMNFNELRLIRSQWRKMDGNRKNRELLLGDIHPRRKLDYKPTAFQTPLLEINHAYDCVNCRVIAKGTERAPPQLLSKPQLPPMPHGQWVSQRCEVRPPGNFLTRRFSFDSRDRTWMAEYKFYADPICTESYFTISESGKYYIEPVQNRERILKKQKTGTNLLLHVEEAFLTLYDYILRDTFYSESNCGIGSWYIGITKDLTPTSGCSVLGITLPSNEYDLINLEIDRRGTPLLLLGQKDIEGEKRIFHGWPTSYQAPLAQCSVFPRQNNFYNHLEPTSKVLKHSASSCSASCHIFASYYVALIFSIVFFY